MKDFFSETGFVINGVRHLSAGEAFFAIAKGAVLIDVRDEYMAAMFTFAVDNYILCPFSSLGNNISALPKDKPLIVADATGLKSKMAVEILQNKGFSTVANLAGGIMDWQRDGFPVNKDPKEQLSGQCPCMLKPMNKVKKS